MKIVENLFPELCNIYGESYSMTYLSRCNPEIDLRLTNHKTTPAFVTEDVDMIYLGCSPERKQEQIIQLLRPYLVGFQKKCIFVGDNLKIQL